MSSSHSSIGTRSSSRDFPDAACEGPSIRVDAGNLPELCALLSPRIRAGASPDSISKESERVNGGKPTSSRSRSSLEVMREGFHAAKALITGWLREITKRSSAPIAKLPAELKSIPRARYCERTSDCENKRSHSKRITALKPFEDFGIAPGVAMRIPSSGKKLSKIFSPLDSFTEKPGKARPISCAKRSEPRPIKKNF